MASPDRKTEVRVLLDYDLAQAFDCVAMSKRMTSTELTRYLIQSYTASKQREASVISKAPQIYPPSSDSAWSPLE